MVGTRIPELFSELGWLFNHQVYIQRFFRGFSEKINDHRTETDIRYKSAIHYIQVIPIRFAFIEHFAIGREIQEICGKKRWGNDWHSTEFALQVNYLLVN